MATLASCKGQVSKEAGSGQAGIRILKPAAHLLFAERNEQIRDANSARLILSRKQRGAYTEEHRRRGAEGFVT